MSLKTDVIRMSLENAENWELKGQPEWVNRCLASALMNYLSVAVEDKTTIEDAVPWLREVGADDLLRRFYRNVMGLVGEIDAHRHPASLLGGNYSYLVYAHLAWALEDFQLGESFVAISMRTDISDISTPFWNEYAKAMSSLVHGLPYKAPDLQLRGQEEYWYAYIYLIEVVIQRQDLEESILRVRQTFAKRNTDRKIKDDNFETEGSGRHPSKWDYRLDSLLTYIGRRLVREDRG
jgi:hypothetical protein